MNCGLGNLDSLKRHLLPATMQSDKRFDQVIQDIGLGVAGMIDKYTNRVMTYAEGVTRIWEGQRSHIYLPLWPIVTITKVELRYFLADSWTNISGQPLAENAETGLLHFGYTLGTNPIQVRVTWTGGYWFETAEPDDPNGYPSVVPAAITNAFTATPPGLEASKYMLPPEVKLAWLLQCRRVWDGIDKLGTSVAQASNIVSDRMIDLQPQVKMILQPYIRYQLS